MTENIDYKLLVEKFSEGIAIAREGKVVFVNEKIAKMLKCKKADIIGGSILRFVHPEDKDSVMKRYKDRVAGKKIDNFFDFRALSAKKGVLYFRISSVNIVWNKKPATLSLISDISKIKEKEEREKENEKKMRGFFDTAEVLIFSLSKDQKIEYINRKGCEILECEEKDALGKNWFDNFLPKKDAEEIKKVFNLLMAGRVKMVENYENPILTFKGNEKIISWHNSILRDENGRPTHVISSGEDITEKKKAENKLEESEQRFRSVFESSPDVIYLKDKNLRYIMVNSQAEKVLGRPMSKIIGKNDSELLKNKFNKTDAELEKEVLTGKAYKGEKSIIIKGKKKYFSVTKTPIRDSEMNIIGFSAVERDITERRTKEKELFLKNKFNNDVLENNPIGIYLVSDKGDVEYVNKAMLDISSADYERFMSLNMFKHRQYKKLGISKNISDALKNGKNFRMDRISYTSTMGKKTTIRNFIGVPLEEGGRKKVLIMIEDITDRISYESKISEQNDFLLTIIDSLSYPFYVVNVADFKLILANEAAVKGKKNIGTCYNVSHGRENPCDTKEHKCPVKETVKTKKPARVEHVHYDLNGKKRYVEVHSYPIFNSKGGIDRVIEYSIDITERKIMELKLEKEEERFKDILDGANDLIQSVDTKGNVIYVNKAWKKALGYRDNEITKLNIFNIIHPQDRPGCQKELDEILSGKKLGNLITRFKTKNGNYIHVSGAVSCKFENGKPVSTRGIFRDITRQYEEQKELKKRTEEIEKFNKLAVGRELKMIELKKTVRDLEDKLYNFKNKTQTL